MLAKFVTALFLSTAATVAHSDCLDEAYVAIETTSDFTVGVNTRNYLQSLPPEVVCAGLTYEATEALEPELVELLVTTTALMLLLDNPQ